MCRPTPYADAEVVLAPTDPPPPTENDTPVPDEATLTSLTVDGILPAALSGRYVRIGPNPTTATATGAGTSTGWSTPWTPRRPRGGVPQSLDRHRPGRPHPGRRAIPGTPAAAYDSVATNVITFGGRTLALGPGALAYELDDQLATVGRVDLAGQGRGIGAHPQLDPITGALHLVSHGDEPAHHIVAAQQPNAHHRPVPDAPGPLHDLLLTHDGSCSSVKGSSASLTAAARRQPAGQGPTVAASSPPTTRRRCGRVLTPADRWCAGRRRRRAALRRPRRHAPALRHHQPQHWAAPSYCGPLPGQAGPRCTATTSAPATGRP